MLQCSPSVIRTGSLGKRCTSSTLSSSGPRWPSITRPLVAPRSTAATHPLVIACPSTGSGHICGLSPSKPARSCPSTGAVLSPSKGSGHVPQLKASPQESGGNAGVDGNVQAGGVTQIGRAEHEDRVGDVLRQHLALQQRARRVVLAQLLLGHPVDSGSLGSPAACENAGATDDTIGIDAVHFDAVFSQLRG